LSSANAAEDLLMIRRREFIVGLGGAAVWPVAARAQQAERVRRIGVLEPFNDSHAQAELSAFMRGLAEWQYDPIASS